MTMRTALMVLAVCAGLAASAPVLQAQNSPALQCPPSGGPAAGKSDLIWAFG